MNIRKNLSLFIGISLPIIMIAIVAASVYLPRLWASPPQVNFLYSMADSYDVYGEYYSVESGILKKQETADKNSPTDPAIPKPIITKSRLYLHDVVTNKSREVTFAEAQKFQLDYSIVSLDGFEIVHGNSGGGFFLFGSSQSDYNSRFLRGHGISIKMNLISSPEYSYSFRFLGWVGKN